MERAIDYIFIQLDKQERGMNFITSGITKAFKQQTKFNKNVNRQLGLCGIGFLLTALLYLQVQKQIDILEGKVEESK